MRVTPSQKESCPITKACRDILDANLKTLDDETRRYLGESKMYNASRDKDYKPKSCRSCNSMNYSKNAYCNNCGNKI